MIRLPFRMKWEILKSITGIVEWLTILFFFMLSNCASDMICLFSSTVGDRPRKWQSLSTSRSVSYKTKHQDTPGAQRQAWSIATNNPTTLNKPLSCLRRTYSGGLNTSVFSSTSHSRGRTRIQTPLKNTAVHSYSSFILYLWLKWKCFLRTLSLHESAEVTAPFSDFWLKLIHAIKVEIGHGVVFGITGHVNDLHREQKYSITFFFF